MNIVPFIETYIIDSMCGGFKKRGIYFCSHYLRAMSSFARRSAMSSVILFVDIRSAFASVIRALVFPDRCSDSFIFHVFKSLKFLAECFREFLQTVRDTCALVSAGVPQPMISVVSNLASNSFFVMKGISGLVHYKKGTGAGTPTADLLFTFLMARVMRAIHSKLVAANLIPLFDADPDCFFKDARSGSFHIMGASLIDDSFFNSIHVVPAVCVTNAASIATIVFDEFALHSMDIDLEESKAEFMLQQIGPG